jgi:hypothetical protein
MLADYCNEIVKAKKWPPLVTSILELTELQNGIPYRGELFVTSVIVVLVEQRASRMSRNLPPTFLLDGANTLQA